MTQKNTFKSVPLYDSGNCLYQRRTPKSSNGPMTDSSRNINRFSSEECSVSNYSKGGNRELPVEGDTFEANYVTERSKETSVVNRPYQSKPPSSDNYTRSCPKSNYSSGQVSAKRHIGNYQRTSDGFREDDQQYSSESDANANNEYYPEKTVSERKKFKYRRSENNQKEFEERGTIWNRRSSKRNSRESSEDKFYGEHHLGSEGQINMTSGLNSDIKFARNPSPPISEDYEENYLDMQMENRRDENVTCQKSIDYDQDEERQNSIEVHGENIEQVDFTQHLLTDDREFEYGSQESYEEDKPNKDVETDYECSGNWGKNYQIIQTDKRISPKLQSVYKPYPISKPIDPLPHYFPKQIKPSSNPRVDVFPESTNSQIYYSRGPTNLQSHSLSVSTTQSISKLPHQKSLQISGGSQTTQLNITSDISATSQKNLEKSDTQGNLVIPSSKVLQKSVMKKQKPTRRDGVKAFETDREGIVTIVVLEGFPVKKMVASELNQLATAILNEIDKIAEGVCHPQFVEYTKKKGSLIIVSENRYSANWLKSVVGILEPWRGARFKTIEREQEPIMWLSIFSGDPKILLNSQQLDLVQKAIIGKIEDIVDRDFQPEILDWYQKHQSLVVACNNRKTADWLRKILQTLEPWQNAQIACIDPTELDGYKKFKMKIVPWDDPNTILDRIESQNDNLCTGSWKIIHSEFGKNRKSGVLVVAVKTSLIEVLRGVNFRPFLNLGRVFLEEVGDYNLY